MILFGLVMGRWWRAALVSAAIVWPMLLIVTGVPEPGSWLSTLLLGGLLAVANAAVGVAVHQALLGLVRLIRQVDLERRRKVHP
ncbi:hypothetical protein [Tessaracoccus rhinocerotis]|nr:hypothetical protein [Tessaracoccus rhinocerotis]